MPTVLRVGSYRFHFYASDGGERPHIHVDLQGATAKFWIDDLSLARNQGLSEREVKEAQRIAREHQPELLEAWNGFFGQG